MLSFVIHSKPVLACYSSPDRLPPMTSSQRNGSLELSAVAQRGAKQGFLFLFRDAAGTSLTERESGKRKNKEKRGLE